MQRNLMLSVLSVMVALTFSSAGTSAGMAADPLKCTGYPEPRIYLENQSWWEPQPSDPADPDHPGTGKQGHIHVGTCFPLYQELSGDTLHLDINLKLHNITGSAHQLRVDAYGDYQYDVSRATWGDPGGKPWHCETADCEKWVSVDFPLSRLRYRGDHEWNIYLIVWKSDGSEKQYNVSRWHASVAKPLPEPPSNSVTARSRVGSDGIGGDSWHNTNAGGKYARARLLRADLPWDDRTGSLEAISGLWRPRISFEKRRNFVWVDPHLHAVPPHKGMVIWEGDTGALTNKEFVIDTTKLTNGPHRLVFGTGNVTTSGTHTGVGVVPFLVSNPSGPSPISPDTAPDTSPPPSLPPDDPAPDPSPDPDDPLPPESPTDDSPSEPESGGERDTERPHIHALPSQGRATRPAKLRFVVHDDSVEARVFLTIWRKSVRVGDVRTGLRSAVGTVANVRWRIPRAVSGPLRFCVQAFDRAGNWSPQSCARLKVRK